MGGKGGEGAGQSPDAAAHPGLEEVVARRSPQPLGLGEGHPQGLREFEGRPGEQVPCRAQPEGGEQREVRRRKPRQPPQRPPAHPRPRLHPRSPLPTGPLSKKKKKNIERGLLRSSTEGNSILQFGAGVMIISVQKMFVWLQARTIDPDVVRTQRDLNPWPSGLESDALPLSYAFPGNKSGGIPLIDSSPSQTPLSASGGALIQYILSILRPPAIRKVQAYSTQ